MMKKTKIGLIAIALVSVGFSWFVFGNQNSEPVPEINERRVEENGEEIREYEKDSLIERRDGVEVLDLDVEAAYSIYVEDDESQVLFSRNRNKELPVASLTKLMTAYVVYENYNLSEPVGVPESRYFTDSHLDDLRVFTDTTFEELLYPLLLESNNSGAYAVATAPEEINFDDFIKLMNSTATDLGMRRTIYHNPSGLDTVRDVNLSTARDTATLVKNILDIPLFWEIMKKTDYEIHSQRTSLYYLIETTNKFLDGSYFVNNSPEWHDDIIGGKTGFTYEAMGCLVMVLEVDGGYIINVVLGAPGRQARFEEMEKLIDWVYKAYNI